MINSVARKTVVNCALVGIETNNVDIDLPLLVEMDVVLTELLKKLSHADGVSPRDATTVPEANEKVDAVPLSQQLPDPPALPLQQPKSWVSLVSQKKMSSDALALKPFYLSVRVKRYSRKKCSLVCRSQTCGHEGPQAWSVHVWRSYRNSL